MAPEPYYLSNRNSSPLFIGAFDDLLSTAFGRIGQTTEQCFDGIFTRSQISGLSSDLRFVLTSRLSDISFERWLGLFGFLCLAENRNAQKYEAGALRIVRRSRRVGMLWEECRLDLRLADK